MSRSEKLESGLCPEGDDAWVICDENRDYMDVGVFDQDAHARSASDEDGLVSRPPSAMSICSWQDLDDALPETSDTRELLVRFFGTAVARSAASSEEANPMGDPHFLHGTPAAAAGLINSADCSGTALQGEPQQQVASADPQHTHAQEGAVPRHLAVEFTFGGPTFSSDGTETLSTGQIRLILSVAGSTDAVEARQDTEAAQIPRGCEGPHTIAAAVALEDLRDMVPCTPTSGLVPMEDAVQGVHLAGMEPEQALQAVEEDTESVSAISNDNSGDISGSAAATPLADARRSFGIHSHLRVLNWLLPGIVAIVIGHLASHAGDSSGATTTASTPWVHRPGAFRTTHGAGPVVVGACGGSRPDAVQLVFASYTSCTGAHGACSSSSEWSTGSGGWGSEAYST